MYKFWTNEEIEYLIENWGPMEIDNIAKKLNRTMSAVYTKAHKIKLGSFQEKRNTLTATEVARLLHVERRKVMRWGENGLAIKKKKSEKGRTRINFYSLLEFLKNNQDLWDSRKLEIYSLGKEYKWLKEKREKDKNRSVQKKWSKYDELKLINLVKKGLKTKELVKEFPGRTESSITHKMTRLNITKNILPWKEEEIKILIDSDKKGITDREIAYMLGRELSHITYKRLFLKKRGLHPGKEEIYILHNNLEQRSLTNE